MSTAVDARIQGDEYQAYFFWLQVCKLFFSNTKVNKVIYEANNIKSFDDVVVEYCEPIIDVNQNYINLDCFQIKFHVANGGAFSWSGLMDPSFINASSVSLIQRLKNAQIKYAPTGKESRFHILAPWNISHDDLLAELVSNDEGELRLDYLFRGGDRSNMGKARIAIKQHLGISSDDDLRMVLTPLRIWHGYFNKTLLLDRLNSDLNTAGFRPVENGSLVNPYTSLIRSLNHIGRNAFTRDSIREICEREGLFVGTGSPVGIPIGIRSFYRRAENMRDETRSMICFLKYFRGRYITDQTLWQSAIFPELDCFLNSVIKPGERYTLFLDTHSSIAFAAGYCLDTKVGARICPVQKSIKGRDIWDHEGIVTGKYADWKTDLIAVSESNSEVALILNVTHNITTDVLKYIETKNLPLKRIINCSVGSDCDHTAIEDGQHAWNLACSISAVLKNRTRDERNAYLHLFVSAPISFIFFLGQLSKSFGRCLIYEYDFENILEDQYTKSLEFPN